VNRVITVAAVAVAVVALTVVALRREEPPAPPPAIRLSFPMPPELEAGFADETLDAAISPDGSDVVFVATARDSATGARGSAGIRQLWRRALDAERPQPLPGTLGAQQPAWKPTGRVIAFFADGRLKQITLDDGAVHDLAESPSALGASWLADGSLLFATGGGPIRRLKDGRVTDATTIHAPESAHVFPTTTGQDGSFVYTAVRDDGRRVAHLVTGNEARELTTTAGHAVIVDSRLLHVRDGVLLAYERDGETGELAPRGVPLALNVGVSSTGRALFAASRRLVLHASAAARASSLVWLDFSGTRGATVADAGDFWQVRLSPDDRMAALSSMDPLLRAFDIAVASTDGRGGVERLTLALAADTDPVWAPDAARLLFRSMAGGTADLFARRLRQREEANEVILRSDLDETPTDWRGERVLFQARRSGGADILALDVRTGQTEAIADTAFNETDARWSPDGRWIAYVSDESGRPDVYVRRPDLTRMRVSLGGGRRPRWTRDGRALIFLRGSEVMRAELTGGEPAGTLFSTPQRLFEAPGIRDFDVAHRSDRMVALLPVESEARPEIGVVMNWGSLIPESPRSR
jgi:Tol biopolymer transport system component